jgi:hypothetical protein
MRKILLVTPNLAKSLNSANEPKISTEEKMRMILESHVREAKTDEERERAKRELSNFTGSSTKRAAKPRP